MTTNSELQSQFDKIKEREIKSRRLSAIIALVPFLFGLIWLFVTYRQVEKLNAEKVNTQKEINASQIKLNSIKDSISQIFKAVATISTDSLKNAAYRQQVILTSIKANTELQNISKSFVPDTGVVIRYYFKSVDDQKILQYLQSLGYKFNQKESKNAMSSTNTNAIWFGSKVSVNDAKLIALTLIRAGAKIKAIRPFRANVSDLTYKQNIIEIGGDASLNYENKSPLKVEDIMNAKTFDRS